MCDRKIPFIQIYLFIRIPVECADILWRDTWNMPCMRWGEVTIAWHAGIGSSWRLQSKAPCWGTSWIWLHNADSFSSWVEIIFSAQTSWFWGQYEHSHLHLFPSSHIIIKSLRPRQARAVSMIVIARIGACISQSELLFYDSFLAFFCGQMLAERGNVALSTVNRMEGCALVLWDFVRLLFPRNKFLTNPFCLILLHHRDDFCHFFPHSSSLVSVMPFPLSSSFKTCFLSCLVFPLLFYTLGQTTSTEILPCLSAAQHLIPQQNLLALIPLLCCE